MYIPLFPMHHAIVLLYLCDSNFFTVQHNTSFIRRVNMNHIMHSMPDLQRFSRASVELVELQFHVEREGRAA